MPMGQILGSKYEEKNFESGKKICEFIISSIGFNFAHFVPNQKHCVFQAKKINLPGWNSKV